MNVEQRYEAWKNGIVDLKLGFRGDEESWTKWCVITSLYPAPGFAEQETDDDRDYLWEDILQTVFEKTGHAFGAYWSGAGRQFCNEPCVRITGKRVLVRASGGLDI